MVGAWGAILSLDGTKLTSRCQIICAGLFHLCDEGWQGWIWLFLDMLTFLRCHVTRFDLLRWVLFVASFLLFIASEELSRQTFLLRLLLEPTWILSQLRITIIDVAFYGYYLILKVLQFILQLSILLVILGLLLTITFSVILFGYILLRLNIVERVRWSRFVRCYFGS